MDGHFSVECLPDSIGFISIDGSDGWPRRGAAREAAARAEVVTVALRPELQGLCPRPDLASALPQTFPDGNASGGRYQGEP